jgi:dihydropyrimidinase
MLVEREATHRAIALSELVDVPILIVHVSGREAVEQIRWARAQGLRIHAETCPQYLFLTAESLHAEGHHGAKCVCSPPPRDAANQQVIWNGLSDGLFTIFSSDHAPFNYEDPRGKKPGGREVAFRHIPNGIPGLETRLPLLFSEGVQKGRITLERFVELTATNPAKLYGLYPRKGTIAVGSDADIAIWDREREVTLTNANLHHATDYTPYEGMRLRGGPRSRCREARWCGTATGRAAHPGAGAFSRARPPSSPVRAGWRLSPRLRRPDAPASRPRGFPPVCRPPPVRPRAPGTRRRACCAGARRAARRGRGRRAR